MRAYLCGPIDFTQNGEKLWRRKLVPFLRDQFGHRVLDPSEEATRNLTDEETANLRQWQTADLDRFRRAIRKIIAANLDLIENKTDYLVCYWDASTARSANAPAELTAAHRTGIPVYLVTDLPVEEISEWILGCSDQIFSSVESLKEFLTARFSREKQNQLWKD
jgi:hypothetical protein